MIKSPLNYTGCKFNLLEQIKPLLDFGATSSFVDLFGGSATVCANADSGEIIYNEIDQKVFQIIEYLLETELDLILQEVEELTQKFSLSKLAADRENYYRFREFYNESESKKPSLLFLLSCSSFSNLIRFNRNGNYNVPFGLRQFNQKTSQNLKNFKQALANKKVKCSCQDFESVIIPQKALVYCDPPYLNTSTTYNDHGGWTITEEARLRNYLITLSKQEIKWALSNDLYSNSTLVKWANDNNFTIHSLEKDYNNSFSKSKRKKGQTKEVLITNY